MAKKKAKKQSLPKAAKDEVTSLRYVKTVSSVSIFLRMASGRKIDVSYVKADDPAGYAEVSAMVDEANRDGIVKRLLTGAIAAIVPELSKGEFEVDAVRRVVRDLKTGTEVGNSLSKRIIEWHGKGLPFAPLLQFHRRVIQNPSKESVADLYAFLDANDIPITPDGRFVGYKRVTRRGDVLMDSHSRTIQNNPGLTVSMPRKEVDPNRNNTCSTGLHVGAWDYVSSFSGNVTVEVLVDPADVVAVPPDYNQQKMRVCRYVVVREMPRDAKPHKGKLVKVNLAGEAMAGNIEEPPNFDAMTAREVKAWILSYDGTVIDIDNKNKRAIVKKAYAVFANAHTEE